MASPPHRTPGEDAALAAKDGAVTVQGRFDGLWCAKFAKKILADRSLTNKSPNARPALHLDR
jgi:hypothetical protein